MTSHCSLVYERVSVCVCSRPSMIEGAGDSAETPPPTTFESVREPSAQFTASFRPPPPLLHPLDIHTLTFSGRLVCVSGLAKEAHRGFHTVSERRRDGCCRVRLLFGQSLSSGYGVGSPDRLFGFSSYSKRFGPRRDFSPLSRETFRLQDQAGLDCWIYLIRLKETGHFE
jgi:hypothetical protein